MAAGPDVVLLEGKWMSGRNGELLCDQVQSGRHLRDGMFNLQPRVHLEEIELASPVDEFYGSGIFVPGCPRDACGGLTDGVAEVGRERRRRRFFDDLLESPLHRTFPLKQVHYVTEGIAENLNLD